MPSTSWRPAIARSGRIQLIGPRKSLMITAMPRRRSGRRSASMAAARSPRTPGGALGMVAMVRSMLLLVHAARQRRDPPHGVAVGDDRADPVAAAAVEVGDRRRGRHRQVALLAAGGAEVEAGRHVDHQPGLQLAVGDHLPHVRVRGARGHRPVHPAHVVAGLVDPRLPRLGARAGQQPEVVAVQHAVELAARPSARACAAPPSAPGRGSPRAAATAGRRCGRTLVTEPAGRRPRLRRRARRAAPNVLAAESHSPAAAPPSAGSG